MRTKRVQKHSAKIKIHVRSEFVIEVVIIDAKMDSARVSAALYGGNQANRVTFSSITDMDELGKALIESAEKARAEIALQKKLKAVVDGEIYADTQLEQDNLRDSATD